MRTVLNKILESNSQLGKLLLTLLYILVYDFVYKNYVVFYFSYMGLSYTDMQLSMKYIWILLSILPILAYRGAYNISSFLCLFIYIFVYIPFVHAIFITWQIHIIERYAYSIIMCIFFVLYFSIGYSLRILKNISIKQKLSLRTTEWITLVFTLIFLILRMKSMHFISIFDVEALYSQRAENAENVGVSIVLYIQGWLSGAFYPFLLVCYLKEHCWLKAGLILLGYLGLFMADMQKLTFALPLVLIGFYFLLIKKFSIISKKIHGIIFLTLNIVCMAFYLAKDNVLANAVGFIVLLRTVCVAGWLTQMYMLFFAHNPYTYYSHINIVNAITGSYPYNVSLGQAVAYNNQNANANFFLMDGVAACGILGVILVGVLFYLLLHVINAISYKYKTTDLLVIFLPTLSYLLNASIFTTMLSSGLFILLIILSTVDNPLIIKGNGKIN